MLDDGLGPLGQATGNTGCFIPYNTRAPRYNELFERKLTHMYTAATSVLFSDSKFKFVSLCSPLRYVDELDSVDDVDRDAAVLMCLVEQPRGAMGIDERVSIGMVVVCPSTGDVVWDEFDGRYSSSWFAMSVG